jgi:hypothetical protein
VQEDKKLIEEYKWQLQAYCYIFKKEKAYCVYAEVFS